MLKVAFFVIVLCSPLLALHVRLPAGDPGLLKALYSHGITVGKQTETHWDAYLQSDQLPALKNLTRYARVQEPRGEVDMTHYTSYYALMAFCSRMQKEYPALATRFSIGKSVHGKELLGVRIRKGRVPKARKIKLIGNMHGDETVGRELLIRLIEHVLASNATDEIQNLLDVAEIHILPTMNPDGFDLHWRTNALGYDLNRNFPDRFMGQITPMQPETAAIIQWSLRENFTLSANFHGGDLVANYPYDGNKQHRSGVAAPTSEEEFFEALAHAYADNHPDMNASTRFPGGITNGAKWYVLYGGMQDWNYLNTHAKEITLEVSKVKRPHGSLLQAFWDKNHRSMIEFMKQIHLF